MSVLVKGMEMPENCCICWFSSHDMCLVCGKDADDWFEERPEYCPLIELPDHGDLVDIDAMLGDFAELRDYDFASREYVVVPAEKSEASLCICDNCDQRNDKGCSVCKYIIKEGSEDGEN